METVVKLRSSDEKPAETNADAPTGVKVEGDRAPAAPAQGDQEVPKLVDSKDNQFVLSKGSDSTVPHEDHHLIKVWCKIGALR